MRRNDNMLPDFLIAGAGKSGSSSLYYYLNQHPNIYLPYLKEIKFFSTIKDVGKYHKGIEWYKNFFKEAAEKKERGIKCGEASMIYFYDPQAAPLIKKWIPEVKLIFILRNPVSRSYSNYWQDIKSARRLPKFESLIKNIDWDNFDQFKKNPFELKNRGWAYLWTSDYGRHLKRYLKYFNRRQILVLLFEDIANIDHDTFRQIFSHLEVDPDFIPLDLNKKNTSAVPKLRFLEKILNSRAKQYFPFVNKTIYTYYHKLKEFNKKKFDYPPMDKECKQNLVQFFDKKIPKLEQIIGRDLSHWRSDWDI